MEILYILKKVGLFWSVWLVEICPKFVNRMEIFFNLFSWWKSVLNLWFGWEFGFLWFVWLMEICTKFLNRMKIFKFLAEIVQLFWFLKLVLVFDAKHKIGLLWCHSHVELRLIEVEVDWSWGWLELRLIEVEVDWSWGWLKLK